MEDHLRDIVHLSFGSAPEEMLKRALEACIQVSGASGGSILGEEGPYLQFLFADVEDLIGVRVPFDSIAGVTVTEGKVIYTYAPSDTRHFEGVDAQLKSETRYLLSIPIPSVVRSESGEQQGRNAGALQLLFGSDIFPEVDVTTRPAEFAVGELQDNAFYQAHLKDLFWMLPIVAFGMEVMKLRQTSYQAIHELKNKLISGLSWIGYLREDIKRLSPRVLEDDNVRDDFDLAGSSIREGADLAKTYLQLTRIYTPHFEAVIANDLLEEIAASVRALAREMEVPAFAVETDLAPDLPKRPIDPGQLKMALFNLCKNAVEALHEHRVPRPRIRIQSSLDGAALVLRIADNGPGMLREIADNLFVPFKTKKEGGTGLGLTITKKIIDIHGGQISCTTGDSGTTFTLRL